MNSIVITVDGPSGCGKGTISQMLAKHLGYHLLDSGALYRLVAYRVLDAGVDPSNEAEVVSLTHDVSIDFKPGPSGEPVSVWIDGEDYTLKIRDDASAQMASEISKIQGVRSNLLDLQREFACAPGLVADGRDMGTVVFPNAAFKLYLDASARVRAQRRYKQLSDKGFCVNLREIESQLVSRDRSDQMREYSPLLPAPDAMILDTSDSSIDAVFADVLFWLKQRGLGS